MSYPTDMDIEGGGGLWQGYTGHIEQCHFRSEADSYRSLASEQRPLRQGANNSIRQASISEMTSGLSRSTLLLPLLDTPRINSDRIRPY